jgi:prophage regulatory protein
MGNKVLRLKAVKDLTGLSRSSIYAMIKNREFPSNISLGSRSVGWLESDIQKWIDSRINKSRQEG